MSTPARKRATDPYLAWAALTECRYLARGPAGPLRLAIAIGEGDEPLDVEGVRILPCGGVTSGYRSAEVALARPADLVKLFDLTDFVLAEPGMWPAGKAHARGPAAAADPSGAGGPTVGKPVVIGVIDGLCGFANSSFCTGDDPPLSRIDFFWDQGADPEPPWRTPSGSGYGRELDREALDGLLRDHLAGTSGGGPGLRAAAERALYERARQALPIDADWSHGTHVLDTIVTDLDAAAVQADHAATPGIVYVQLPAVALRDTSARWTASYVLDALHYVIARAGDQAQVLVNLSLGSFGGPHDGSTLLERAIDALVDQCQGRLTVVVAAGNAGQVADDATGATKACHLRVPLDAAGGPKGVDGASGASADLVWEIDVADDTESFMEIWLPGEGPDGKAARIEVTLLHRDRKDTDPVGKASTKPGECGLVKTGDGTVTAAVFNASGGFQVPTGSGGMILVALGHTRDGGGPCARPGDWIVRVTNRDPWPITLDAWVERRDIPGELGGVRPQYGFGAGSGGVVQKGSLGTLANGRRSTVVGAVDPDPADDGTYAVSDYSSVGVADLFAGVNARTVARCGPDLYCVGKREGSGFLSASRKTLSGTSMAAAQASAWLATELCQPAEPIKGVASPPPPVRRRDRLLDDVVDLAARSPAPGSAGTPPGRKRPRTRGPSRRFVLPPPRPPGNAAGGH